MLVININGILAVGFSPSSLIYELNTEEEGCQMITINSDSDTIALSDNWAENKDVEWRVNSFNTSSESHLLSLNYPKTISKNDKQTKICLKGYKAGEYHGILLLKEEQKGNSIIQIGIWLKAVIAKNNNLNSKNIDVSLNVSSGNQKTFSNAEISSDEKKEIISSNEEAGKITGNVIANVISNKNNSMYYWSIGILAVLIIGILIIIYNRKRDPFKL